jgi:hypothetical protein
MNTFRKLLEDLDKVGADRWDEKPPSNDLGEDSINLIKRGIELRPDISEGQTFWDDLLNLFGANRASAAKLFGVDQASIDSILMHVRKALTKVQQEKTTTDSKS